LVAWVGILRALSSETKKGRHMNQTNTSAKLPDTGHVFVLPGLEAISQEAANRFVALANAHGLFTVALSGGSTPRRMYEMLADDPFRDRIPWDRVHVFWGDERCVPLDHADSNYRMANEVLLSKVPIPPGNVHRIKGELEPEHAAVRYEAELRTLLGPGGRLDLVLLGVGNDGHTASLFPGTTSLQERERSAVAVYVHSLQSWRVTLTLPTLNAARNVIFLVSGSGKASVLARIRARDPSPAGMIRPVQGQLTWLIDRAAARNL